MRDCRRRTFTPQVGDVILIFFVVLDVTPQFSIRWQIKPIGTKCDHGVKITPFLHSVVGSDISRTRSLNIFTAENYISVVPPISNAPTGVGQRRLL